MSRTLMVMAAGTGGHIMPGLAVANELRGRGWKVTWLGTETGMENTLVPKHGIALDAIGFTGLRGKGLLHALTGGLRLLLAMRQSWRILKRRQPDVVLGMGGYVTVPGGLMASLADIPLLIHNADATMLMSNRFLAPLADRLSFGFASIASQKYGVRAHVTGNPVRPEIAALPAPDVRYRARTGPLCLLVVGGSLGAQALNRVLPETLRLLVGAERPEVVHQAGAKEAGAVRASYVAAGVQAEVLPFIDDMPQRYAAADVVLCRAGAITVAELCAAGVASILVPLTVSTTSHQRENAIHLSDAGAAIHLPQPDLTPEALAQLVRGLDRERLRIMATAARELAEPDATRRVAALCEDMARP
ncbi:MAG: undecaprenyldiphospho-muramoylpentapeptide beta-N-acetylglucosaminyltransferase [Betaproteobacteria bacterium]|nr:undecaprenyldiphospho-muramoylpentapeptide beta-N-acetylglucosaminyltransferase [Betaproteobacteria bacterium]